MSDNRTDDMPDVTHYPDDIELSEAQERAIRDAIRSGNAENGDAAFNTALKPDAKPDFKHLAPPKNRSGVTALKVLFIIVVVGAICAGAWFFWWTQYATFEYTLQPVVILDGQSVEADAFVPEGEALRGVTAAFKNPDFKPVSGPLTVPLVLHLGLRSLEANANIYVLSPIEQLSFEYGVEAPDLQPTDLLKNSEIARNIVYDLAFVETPLPIAEYEVGGYSLSATLNGAPFTVPLLIADTTLPSATPRDVTVWIGEEVTPEDFLDNVFDYSEPLSIGFAGENEGEEAIVAVSSQIVEVNVTDAHGNTNTFAGSLTVQLNDSPPVFKQKTDEEPGYTEFSWVWMWTIESMVDAPVNYPQFITAVDDFGRQVEFTIDDSQVDTSQVGTYTAVYAAVDLSGLRHEEEMTVHIIPVDPDEVDQWVDETLSEILEGGMSDEEMLRAIFEAVRDALAPSDSDIEDEEWTGSVYAPAHYAITNERGEYYHFAALSEVLLTRAGFVNMRIERSESSRVGAPHFWNLVYIENDGWYHFDSMPVSDDDDINSAQHMFTQKQAEDIAKSLADDRDFGKEGYYDYVKVNYPDVVAE